MLNYNNKTSAKLISLTLIQTLLFINTAFPESLSNKNTYSLYIHDEDLRVPLGSFDRIGWVLNKAADAREIDILLRASRINLEKEIIYLNGLSKLIFGLADPIGAMRSESAGAIKYLIEINLVTIEEIKERIPLDKLILGLVDSNEYVRAGSANAIKSLAEAGLIAIEDIKGKPLLLNNLIIGLTDSYEPMRTESANTIKSLIEAGLIAIEDIKGKPLLLNNLIIGLTDSYGPMRTESDNAIKSLIRIGLITMQDLKGKIQLDKFILGLVDSTSVYVCIESAGAIKSLAEAGLITIEDVKGKPLLLNNLMLGLADSNGSVRIGSANAIKSLIEAGLIDIEDVKGKIPLNNLILGLTDSYEDMRAESANAIKSLIEAGLIDIEDVKGKAPLDNLIRGLTESDRRRRAGNANAVRSLIEAGLIAIEDVKGKVSLSRFILGLTDPNVYARIENANVIISLIETGFIIIEDINEKSFLLDKVILGLTDLNEYVRIGSANAIKSLAEAGLITIEEIKGKHLLLNNLMLGLADSNGSVRLASANAIKSLIGKNLITIEDIKVSTKDELKWLHSNMDNPKLNNSQRALILKAVSILKEKIELEEIRYLAKLIDSIENPCIELEDALNVMCYFSLNRSSQAQDVLEGKINNILGRSIQIGYSYVQVSPKDIEIIKAVLNSFRQASLLPFVYRKDIDPNLRTMVIKELAVKGLIDIEYANIPQDKQEDYLDAISKVYEKFNIISPYLLIEMLLSKRITIKKISNSRIKLKEITSKGDYREIIKAMVKSRQLMILYYCFSQPLFTYQGANNISFERFRAIIKKAYKSMKLTDESVVTKNLRSAFIKAGLSDDVAGEITQSLVKGHAPLPKNSRFLDESGNFIPQEADILVTIGSDNGILEAQKKFNIALVSLTNILKINQLVLGIDKGLKKLEVTNPEQVRSLREEYDSIILDIRNNTANLSECLARLIDINNRIYTKQQVPIETLLDIAIERIISKALALNTAYKSLFTLRKDKLESGRQGIAIDSLNLGIVARNIDRVKKALMHNKRTLSFLEQEIFGQEEIVPQAILVSLLSLVREKAGIVHDNPLYGVFNETMRDIVKIFENYISFIKKAGMESSIPQVVYLDYIDKNNIFEALRFSDGAHCCNSSDPKVNSQFGEGIYDNNAHRWLADTTTIFFQISTEPRGGKQIGWLKMWFGIDKDGLPFLGSNFIYLAPAYQDRKLQRAILDKIEEVLFSINLSMLAQAKPDHHPANSLEPPEDYKEEDLSIIRLQSLKDNIPMQADVKFRGNALVTANFYVKRNLKPDSVFTRANVEAVTIRSAI